MLKQAKQSIDYKSGFRTMQPFVNNLGSPFDGVLQGAFPDNSNTPSKIGKHLHMPRVPSDIPLELLAPEFAVGLRHRGIPASVMPVPKAAMHKYHCPVFGEHYVRNTRQRLDMKPIPKAPRKKAGAKRLLGPGILRPDARHHTAALGCGGNAHNREPCQSIKEAGK